MLWLILYIVLLVIYVAVTAYHLSYISFSYPLLIGTVAGSIPIIRLVLQDLAKHHLPLYFWLERVKLKFKSDTTGKWWFHARYDGVSRTAFETLENDLVSPKFKIRMIRRNSREKEFEIDDTLFLSVTYTGGDAHSGEEYQQSYLDVTSKIIEVSYGHAKKKLESQIEPLLLLFDNIIKPDGRSFELNVEFLQKQNPFFNVYIANLSASQIEDFRVVLHVDGNSPEGLKDKVVISSNRLKVTAESTNSFRKLAHDFILLTPDTRMLIGEKDG